MTSTIKANPNRMELMKLSKRHRLAKRGHRLLKDKQDDLMDRFIGLSRQVVVNRREAETRYSELREKYFFARAGSDDGVFRHYCAYPPAEPEYTLHTDWVMNIPVPRIEADFRFSRQQLSGVSTSSALPDFIEEFKTVLVSMIELVNMERKLFLLAGELEKVRRRVNALEYIFLPKLEKAMKYISMQLEEIEREDIVRLMKIKDIVRNR